MWVKCILDYLRSSLLKRRKVKYKREREAKESRVNTQLAPCLPDSYYSIYLSYPSYSLYYFLNSSS